MKLRIKQVSTESNTCPLDDKAEIKGKCSECYFKNTCSEAFSLLKEADYIQQIEIDVKKMKLYYTFKVYSDEVSKVIDMSKYGLLEVYGKNMVAIISEQNALLFDDDRAVVYEIDMTLYLSDREPYTIASITKDEVINMIHHDFVDKIWLMERSFINL